MPTPVRDFFSQEFCIGYVSSLFGTQQQCGWAAFLAAPASAQSQQELVNVVKYFLLVLNSCLHQSEEVYLQDDCCGG